MLKPETPDVCACAKVSVAEVARHKSCLLRAETAWVSGVVLQTPLPGCQGATQPLWRAGLQLRYPYSPSDWSHLSLALPRVWNTPKWCHHILELRPWSLCYKCPGIPDSIINIATGQPFGPSTLTRTRTLSSLRQPWFVSPHPCRAESLV